MKYFYFILISVVFFACNNQAEQASQGIFDEDEDTVLIEENAAQKKDFGKIGFELLQKETIGNIRIGMTTEEVEKILGKPESVSEWEFWDSDGYEHRYKTYQNEAVQLNFIKEENKKETLYLVEISKNCTFKTSRNIGIGSTKSAVFEAYKNEISNPNNTSLFIAGTVHGGLLFNFSKDTVSNIFIGAAAE